MRWLVTRQYDEDRICLAKWGLLVTGKKTIGPPTSHVMETEVDGDISLYDPTTESVTVLNSTASDVWLLCDGSHTAEEITNLLASSYKVSRDSIVDDVARTIEKLTESGLIQQ